MGNIKTSHIRHYFKFFIFLLIITGCKYKLSETAKSWIPYELGDILIFESTDKLVDTFHINYQEQYFTTDAEVNLYKVSKYVHSGNGNEDKNLIKLQLKLSRFENGETELSIFTNSKDMEPKWYAEKNIKFFDSISVDKYFNIDSTFMFPENSKFSYNKITMQDSSSWTNIFYKKHVGLIGFKERRENRIWILKKKYCL